MSPPFSLRTLLNYVVDQLHAIEHRPVTKAIELIEKEPEKVGVSFKQKSEHSQMKIWWY